jgi:CelD/BcsL family acetyltransferase involved in cellulose biosynthesis
MRLHDDWDSRGFGHSPVADLVGPFPQKPFLRTWWEHRGEGELMLAESSSAMLPLRRVQGTVEFLGEADLADYHSPLGKGVAGLTEAVARGLPQNTRIVFDSLPRESVDELVLGLARAGIRVEPEQHEVAAIVDLPETPEEFLGLLSGKERHEVRRKRRRFEETFGEARLVRGADGFPAFVQMHRSAEGRKGTFMSAGMESFFRGLLDMDGSVVDVLVGGDDRPVAAAFGFEDGDAYYLYNSAFDPGAGTASPGLVLVALLVEATINAGRHRFDFLKGDEAYKFRLGAVARPLYRLEARL